jgi:hypothetical protein
VFCLFVCFYFPLFLFSDTLWGFSLVILSLEIPIFQTASKIIYMTQGVTTTMWPYSEYGALFLKAQFSSTCSISMLWLWQQNTTDLVTKINKIKFFTVLVNRCPKSRLANLVHNEFFLPDCS